MEVLSASDSSATEEQFIEEIQPGSTPTPWDWVSESPQLALQWLL